MAGDERVPPGEGARKRLDERRRPRERRQLAQQRRQRVGARSPAAARVDDVHGLVAAVARQIAEQTLAGWRSDRLGCDPRLPLEPGGNASAEAALLVEEHDQRRLRHTATVLTAT